MKFVAIFLLSVLVSGVFGSESCANRCGNPYDPALPCHCNHRCIECKNCCSDFDSHCVASCADRCMETSAPSNSVCGCDAECEKSGTCCGDFVDLCSPKAVSHLNEITPPKTRIVGGASATAGEFPWQVTLQRAGEHFCGGSLISSSHVITVAHCNVGNDISVGLGALNYRNPEQLVAMASFTSHPQYNANTIDYDYGIITLVNPAVLGTNVQTITLVEAGRDYIGAAAISGWGFDSRIGIGQSTPEILQKADVSLLTKRACQERYGNRFTITDQMQCIDGSDVVSVCSGDTGGPLTVQDNDQSVLIGAASWAENTCNPSFPGGYAKLSVARAWIDSVIAQP